MRVPLLDLKRQWKTVGPEIEVAVRRVLESGIYILGEEVTKLEKDIAAKVGVKEGIGVTSGTDALIVALQALDIGPGDEVVTTTMSFFATAGAISRLGAKPVFADIDADTLNIDVADALKRVTPKTKAIIPVHLFGRVANVEALLSSGLPIVEDAAQALGAHPVGKYGRIATLSFFPSKNLGAAGDAGMCLTNDPALAERMRRLRAHGSHPKYVHHEVGGNFRIDPIQAAILSAKLPHLDSWNQTRKKNAQRYRSLLAKTPLTLPTEAEGMCWHHFVVRAPKREELKKFLNANEIDCEVYYPTPLHLQPCFQKLGGKAGDLPRAETAAREVLAIPVHPDLDEAQIDFVAEKIRSFYGSN